MPVSERLAAEAAPPHPQVPLEPRDQTFHTGSEAVQLSPHSTAAAGLLSVDSSAFEEDSRCAPSAWSALTLAWAASHKDLVPEDHLIALAQDVGMRLKLTATQTDVFACLTRGICRKYRFRY
mgnify:CR=1 FL=1